jgi:hypothetical protein
MSPQRDWPVNKGLDKVIALLEEIKTEFGEGLSWADLIVLAGTVALEEAGAPRMDFCGGRVDVDTSIPDPVSPNLEYMNREFYVEGRMNASVDDLEQYTLLLGLDPREFTAIMGARALGKIPGGMGGQRTTTPTTLSSGYFQKLVSDDWTVTSSGHAYMGAGGLTILRDDILLVASAPHLAVVQEFAGDESAYLKTLASAWTKMMNADRFDGPTGNVCRKNRKNGNPEIVSNTGDNEMMEEMETSNLYLLRIVVILSVAVGALLLGLTAVLVACCLRKERKNWTPAELRKPLTTTSSNHV